MNKILILGKKSFIAGNLFKYLRKKNSIVFKDFNEIKNNTKSFFSNFDYIINCSIDIDYINLRYKIKNDKDYLIAKKIKDLKVKQIIFSTRKIYKFKLNCKEGDSKKPKCNYSKNKLKTEKNIKGLLKKKLLIFRVSNIIGLTKNSFKKKHKTFIDIFFQNIKKNIIFENEKNFKDFVHIKKFCEIVELSINSGIYGTYNLSIGKKIYLNKLVNWLNTYNKNKKKMKLFKRLDTDSFYLNNSKLKSKIKFTYKISDLKKDCLEISKNYFSRI